MASAIDFHSRSRTVFVVTTTTFALATLFVVARLVSRFAIVKTRTADDWMIIGAWFISFGLSFAIDYGTSKGLGRHDADIPDEWLPGLHQSEYAFTILYNPALMATKTSILIFYLRMSRNTQKLLRKASYVTLVLVNVSGIVLTFLNAFQCHPVFAAYDPTKTNAECISIVTLYLCSAPVNIITDLAILVLPIPVLTGMRLPQKQKTVLVFTFALGIFVTIVDVVRIYYLQQASSLQIMSQGRLGTEYDFAWNASTALMWSAVEVNIGIICACIPTLKPLFKRILPSMILDHPSNEVMKTSSLSSQAQPDVEPHRASSIEDPVHRIQPLAAHRTRADPEAEMGMMDFLTMPGMDAPNPTRQSARNQEAEMDMMDFLTMPGMEPPNRTQTARTSRTTKTSRTDNTVYFGFVNMRRPRSMLATRGKESFKYCTIVTILFFLWGFSYGLLNTLNTAISDIAHQSTSQTLGLTTAYFGGYFFGALTIGQWTLRHGGFKATFITGLCIYGTGTLMFWPSAVLTSFPGFILSNLVVGFGLSVLETAANPFLALCGPSQYAEYRLLLAQGVQGVGSTLSQLLAQKALFPSVVDTPSLIDVQWTYLGVALFTVILALFFFYMPLPEASDAALQAQSEDLGIYPSQRIFNNKLPLVYTTLALAVFAQFLYVAAQESMSVWFSALLKSLSAPNANYPPLTISLNDYGLVAHALFAIGRFLFAPLCLFIPPRFLLLATMLGGLTFAILTEALPLTANGVAGPALVFFFFEGPVWPIVYAIGLRGLGKHTKLGAGLITAAASGGGLAPFVMWAVQRVDHKSVRESFWVIVALFLVGLVFPVYLCVVKEARRQVDPRKGHESVDLGEGGRGFHEEELRRSGSGESKGGSGRFGGRLSTVFEKVGGKKGADGKRGGSAGSGSLSGPVVEHREGDKEEE